MNMLEIDWVVGRALPIHIVLLPQIFQQRKRVVLSCNARSQSIILRMKNNVHWNLYYVSGGHVELPKRLIESYAILCVINLTTMNLRSYTLYVHRTTWICLILSVVRSSQLGLTHNPFREPHRAQADAPCFKMKYHHHSQITTMTIFPWTDQQSPTVTSTRPQQQQQQ